MANRSASGWIFLAVFFLVIVTAVLLVFREWTRDEPDVARRDTRSSAGAVEPDAERTAPRSQPEGAAAEPAPESSPAVEDAESGPPPQVRGFVLGPDGGVEGADVRLFALREIYATVDRIEREVMLGDAENLRGIVDAVQREIESFAQTGIRARTDEEGWFEYHGLEPGAYIALTVPPGHVFEFGDAVVAPETPPARDGESAPPVDPFELTIHVDRGAPIAGTVLDASGSAASGVTLTAVPHPPGMTDFARIVRELIGYVNGEFLRGPLVTTSASDGEFTFDVLPHGTYDLVATREGAAPVEVDAVRTGDTGVLVTLVPGAELVGTVAAKDGGALEGILVRLLPRTDLDSLPIPGIGNSLRELTAVFEKPLEARTDARGVFRLREVMPGSYHLQIEASGYLPVERDLEARADTVVDLGRFELDPGRSVYGRVVDQGGRPVAGATVSAFPARDGFTFDIMAEMEVKHRTETGENGQFVLPGLAEKKYELTATAPGYGSASVEDVDPGTGTKLVLSPGWDIRGRVVDGSTGEPIPGARVRAGGVEADTDRGGTFELLDAAPGEDAPAFVGRRTGGDRYVRVVTKHPDFVTDRHRFERDDVERGELVVEMRRRPVVQGTVRDAEGEPVTGAVVLAVPPGEAPEFFSDNLFTAGSVTDLEGRYRLRVGTLGEDIRVKAVHPQYAVAYSDDLNLRGGEAPASVDLVLTTGGVVSGTVTDGTYPLSGVEVRLGRRSEEDEQRMMLAMFGIPAGGRRTSTDENGQYRFEQVAAGAYEVEAKGVHFADSAVEPLDLGAGGETVVDFVLDPGGVIHGTVVDGGGRPLAGARVRISEMGDGGEEEMVLRMMGAAKVTVVSDEVGYFRAVGVPREPMIVSAELDGFVRAELPEVWPDGGAIELVLVPEARIAGTVTDASGSPIHEFQVELRRRDGAPRTRAMPFDFSDRGRTFQDSSGRFFLGDLEPGRYRLQVRARGFAIHEQEVELGAGQSERLRIALVESGRLTGVVVDDETGDPVRGAALWFRSPDETGESFGIQELFGRQRVRTGEGGRFRMDEIPAGETVLVVQHQSYITELRELRLAPGQSDDIKVRLRRGFRVSGRVVGPEGAPVQVPLVVVAQDGSSKVAFVNEEGRFQLHGLAPGRYVFRPFQGATRGEVAAEMDLVESRDDLEITVGPR